MDFYIEQGLLNIQLLAKALSDHQLVGDIMKATLCKWKWKIGRDKNPFIATQYKYPQDESRRLRSVREFSIRNNIEIYIGENKFPLQRENDKFIMEAAEEMGFNSFELRFLNHCRLFLNVISISDITSESGKSLDPTVMKFKNYQAGNRILEFIKANRITPSGQYGLSLLQILPGSDKVL
jgi:hypothetical protein